MIPGNSRATKEQLREIPTNKALNIILILGPSASEIVPALVESLKERDSINRPSLVNSFMHVGPSSIQVIPIALEDLKSELEQIRQQGVIMLGAAASYDDGALNSNSSHQGQVQTEWRNQQFISCPNLSLIQKRNSR